MSEFNFEILPTDSYTELSKRLNNNVGEKMILLVGNCTAVFDGRIKSTLDRGDRLLIIKRDLSIIMHGPLGVKPLNWQKPKAGPIHFRATQESLEMITQRIKTDEILSIDFTNLSFVSLWHASDKSEMVIYGSESDLVQHLVSNPNLIEEGFQVLRTEYSTDVGPVDIRGIGSSGETIVEVKKRKATPADAHQLKRYIEYFEEKEEKDVVGVLVAPDFPEKVLQYLEEHNLISKKIPWDEIFPTLKRPKSALLEEFFGEKKEIK